MPFRQTNMDLSGWKPMKRLIANSSLAKLSAHRETIPPLATPPRAQVVLTAIDVTIRIAFVGTLKPKGPMKPLGLLDFLGIPISHYACCQYCTRAKGTGVRSY